MGDRLKTKFKLLTKLKRPSKKVVLLEGLALCVLILFLLVHYHEYTSYSIKVEDTGENTLVYTYCTADGNILKYATDSAVLTDSDNENIWTIEYDMNDPEADICGDIIALYDEGGTAVVVCDESGRLYSYRTDMPIVKVRVSSLGTAAALLDDGSNAQIDYYDTDGSLIATIKTTMENDGYPMDIALSDDGMLLGVSYLTFSQSSMISKVYFYGFDATGQSASDNIVGSFSYSDKIIPEIVYTKGGRFTAFCTDGVVVYEYGKAVEEKVSIAVDGNIKSTFSDDKYFGYISESSDGTGSEIVVYSSKGKEISRIETDFSYTSVEIYNSKIIMYNRNALAVYTASGIKKFEGEMQSLIRQIRAVGKNRYAVSATDGYYIIRLY